ncbi:hypothetical protein AQ611_08160 [Burkholderia singularis]|nr:hypothetical protein AQ611_08160 [Burkholderia sp. Bp7605]
MGRVEQNGRGAVARCAKGAAGKRGIGRRAHARSRVDRGAAAADVPRLTDRMDEPAAIGPVHRTWINLPISGRGCGGVPIIAWRHLATSGGFG